jgi:hypothetical protein
LPSCVSSDKKGVYTLRPIRSLALDTEVVSGTYVLKVSVYVDSDAVRLYRAGKASVWHAGVLLAVPTASSR